MVSGCGWPMHARLLRRRAPHFAHQPGAPEAGCDLVLQVPVYGRVEAAASTLAVSALG